MKYLIIIFMFPIITCAESRLDICKGQQRRCRAGYIGDLGTTNPRPEDKSEYQCHREFLKCANEIKKNERSK